MQQLTECLHFFSGIVINCHCTKTRTKLNSSLGDGVKHKIPFSLIWKSLSTYEHIFSEVGNGYLLEYASYIPCLLC